MAASHWLALSRIGRIGGVTARHLLRRFGSVQAVFAAEDDELLMVPRLTAEMVARLRDADLESYVRELAELAADGIRVLTWDDPDYPANLAPVPDAPPLLYLRGTLRPERDGAAVAIVGTRTPSDRAISQAEELAAALAGRGVTIVSGLALGIDTAAHRGALRAGGRTIAVPGSGLGAIHPVSNRPLAEQIARAGALLSELPPLARPSGPSLMARDRIVSGLSRVLIVVEAAEESGSVDT
ncbi:MAG: DNA-processing protein DprA, partial [Anaerolineae bacterium]